jgi:hypothetical protein
MQAAPFASIRGYHHRNWTRIPIAWVPITGIPIALMPKAIMPEGRPVSVIMTIVAPVGLNALSEGSKRRGDCH